MIKVLCFSSAWCLLFEKGTQVDTVEKVTSQSGRSFPLWPMTGATLLSNLSNENVGATIDREGSVSTEDLSRKLVSHTGSSSKLYSLSDCRLIIEFKYSFALPSMDFCVLKIDLVCVKRSLCLLSKISLLGCLWTVRSKSKISLERALS